MKKKAKSCQVLRTLPALLRPKSHCLSGQRWGGRKEGEQEEVGWGNTGGDRVSKPTLHHVGQPRTKAEHVRQPKMINRTKLLGGSPSKSVISKILKKLGIFFGKS